MTVYRKGYATNLQPFELSGRPSVRLRRIETSGR